MLSKTMVKYIQSLGHKKLRDEGGIFIAEGHKVVAELFASGKFKCKLLCAVSEWMNDNKILLTGLSAENKIEISETELQKISLLTTPNSVLAIFYKKVKESVDLKNNLSLMLDGIQDPGNMGSIIRNADWFGVKNIICSNNCVDSYNPKVVQSTMGSLARVNIVYTDLKIFLDKNKEIKTYAATLDGEIIFSFKKIKEGIILIGNESKGVSGELLNLCSNKITIPKHGEAESLNAAVACGIILSHII